MRYARLSAALMAVVLLLVLAVASTASAATTSRTYTVWVGAENSHRGVGLMAYFPSHITVHAGDTVHFVQNSNEIHTVTFLGGAQLPELIVPAASLGLPTSPSPLVLNPQVVARTGDSVTLSDTSTWANSGIMGHEPGQYSWFDVTFTATGTYDYVCVVHGTMMSGQVTVVAPGTPVATPMKDKAIANYEIARMMAKVPAVMMAARASVPAATQNADGTWTHHILLGYGKGQIDLMRFFPRKVDVRPGDTVQWEMGPNSMAPHTVTFLNGGQEPALFVPVAQSSGPPVLYVGPGALFPTGQTTLIRTGLYNSGLLLPAPGTTYSLIVGGVTPGPLRYFCMLHDTSGMRGQLVVLPGG